jgi:hypothetical protein
MCEAECNYAAVTLPNAGIPRSLKLSDPLHFTVDASGNIKIDSNIHAVSNGYITTLPSSAIVYIEFQLVLPSGIGCNTIEYNEGDGIPKMYVTFEKFGIFLTEHVISGNVIEYTIRLSFPAGPVCLSTVSFENVPLGTISLGCGCDRPDGCQRIPTSFLLTNVQVP